MCYDVNGEKKAESASYQLKDVAQLWNRMWPDGWAPGEVPITWDVLKIEFQERFFPTEPREAKVEEFINQRHEGMSAKEYSLKFTKPSKYVPSLVSNRRDEMKISVLEDLEEECRVAMLHEYMDLGRLMVHAQKVEESSRRKRDRER